MLPVKYDEYGFYEIRDTDLLNAVTGSAELPLAVGDINEFCDNNYCIRVLGVNAVCTDIVPPLALPNIACPPLAPTNTSCNPNVRCGEPNRTC